MALFERGGKPWWYTENVMSFGIRPASNVAQRMANLYMALTANEMMN